MRNRLGFLIVLAALAGVATPALGQDRSWQNKWYWGTQGGVQLYSKTGFQAAPTVGAHWFITAGRSALYVAFDQQYYSADPGLFQNLNTGQRIRFGSGQRFQASVFAVPTDTKLQVMLGGGFAISRITDARLLDVLTTTLDQRRVDDATTKGFLVLSGALQYRAGLRWAVFGHYQFMPGNQEFVIRSSQHIFNLGIRYAVTHAEEVVTTER